MDLSSIGKHIREQRLLKNWTQFELAEKAGLGAGYIGMLERGEKTPSLETFIHLINVLEVSADVVLEDITNTGYQVRMSRYQDRLDQMSESERERAFEIIDTVLKNI